MVALQEQLGTGKRDAAYGQGTRNVDPQQEVVAVATRRLMICIQPKPHQWVVPRGRSIADHNGESSFRIVGGGHADADKRCKTAQQPGGSDSNAPNRSAACMCYSQQSSTDQHSGANKHGAGCQHLGDCQ